MIVHIIPGSTPLIMCHATMNEFVISYHSFEALLVRVSDGFSKKGKVINGMPFLAVEDGFETLIRASEHKVVEGAIFSPDRLRNRPEAARYILTLVISCSDRGTHALYKFS
jgi:hypothetical protein